MDKSKICLSCGRPFENRKKWKDNFDEVIYCSKQCKKNKKPTKYMELILELLQIRGSQKSICPSEILPKEHKQNKQIMERVRSAGRLLAYENQIEITQKGKVVTDFKGRIRFRIRK